MRLNDLGIITIIGLMVAAVGAGLLGAHFASKDDGFAEETAEQVIEDTAEYLLGLDDDELDCTIDLTPGSPEDCGNN